MKTPEKLKQKVFNLVQLLADTLFTKPFKKYRKHRRTKAWFKKQQYIHEAKGEIIEQLEPLIMKIYREALRDYHENYPQNHYTLQAQGDIKKFLELKIKDFIFTKK